MKIQSRSEARRLGLPRYFTGKPCKRGHIAERWTSGFKCVSCHREYEAAFPHLIRAAKAKWDKANPAKRRAAGRRRYRANPEKYRIRRRQHVHKNPEKNRASCRKYYKHNREFVLECTKRWQRNNPHRVAATNMLRHARKLRATPAWLTPALRLQMTELYDQALLATKLTGVRHHVDHIQPIRGRDRCGLHVPWNLQLLTAAENMTKGNRVADQCVLGARLPAASSSASSAGLGRS